MINVASFSDFPDNLFLKNSALLPSLSIFSGVWKNIKLIRSMSPLSSFGPRLSFLETFVNAFFLLL